MARLRPRYTRLFDLFREIDQHNGEFSLDELDLMKIVFVSGVLSPFHLEMGREFMRRGVPYHLLFSEHHSAKRGGHWQQGVEFPNVSVATMEQPERPLAQWLRTRLHQLAPDVVIVGSYRGVAFETACAVARERGVRFGVWLEGPNLRRGPVVTFLRDVALARQLSRVDFVLAVGDRAEAIYRRFNPRTALVPYGQSLAALRAYRRPARRPTDPIRFLYSGQLIERQNIGLMLAAICEVHRRCGDCFEFVFSARGPSEPLIDLFLRLYPPAASVIRFDRDFDVWSDRLRPFKECDVFVYPCRHSGWGLVIPEAMAAGQCVLSTRNVEASRYFVRHEVNGLFVDPRVDDWVDAMVRCIRFPDDVARLGERARDDAMDGDVSRVVEKYRCALERFAGPTAVRIADTAGGRA